LHFPVLKAPLMKNRFEEGKDNGVVIADGSPDTVLAQNKQGGVDEFYI